VATPQILSDALANDAFPKEIHVETILCCDLSPEFFEVEGDNM
jgi:hypothetical protein